MPMDQSENITQFALVPSLFGCCYGQPPQIQHGVIVTCPKGMQAELLGGRGGRRGDLEGSGAEGRRIRGEPV